VTAERRPIVIALFVSTFLVALDVSVVSTAMPTVIGQIGGIHLYAWVFAAYLLTSTVTVPIYGKLADLYGRKPTLMSATAIFLVGSMLCGQAQTMEQLIAFRLLQGLGAGGVLPINMTILGDVFPLEERARIQGVFSSVWGVSGLLGPAIGGFLTEQISWRWVFYVNFPLCILTLVLVWLFLHEHIRRRQHKIDVVGALTLTAAVSLLLIALQVSDSPGLQVLLYGLAAVLVPVFIWQERRHPEPLVPLWLFGRRAIGVSTLAGVLMGVVLYGQSTFVPPFIQGVMGASPTFAGFVLAGTSLTWPLCSGIGGRLLLRLGYRIPSVLGGVVLTVGYALMLTLNREMSLWIPFAVQMIIGAGFGFIAVTTLLAAQTAVGWQHRGVVTSATQFSRNIGGTVGVSIAGALFAAGLAPARTAGLDPNDLLSASVRSSLSPDLLIFGQNILSGALHSVYAIFVVVCLAMTIVLAFLPGGPPQQASEPGEPAAADRPAAALAH
jgi:EmrB/QacA subfamily drug resistance transporter